MPTSPEKVIEDVFTQLERLQTLEINTRSLLVTHELHSVILKLLPQGSEQLLLSIAAADYVMKDFCFKVNRHPSGFQRSYGIGVFPIMQALTEHNSRNLTVELKQNPNYIAVLSTIAQELANLN